MEYPVISALRRQDRKTAMDSRGQGYSLWRMSCPSTQKFKDRQIWKFKASLAYKDLVSKGGCICPISSSSVGKVDQIQCK